MRLPLPLRPLVAVVVLAALGSAVAAPAAGQDAALPAEPIPLDDLSAFRDPGANWSVAGAASSDRTRPGDLGAAPGAGVLVNRPTEDHRANLFTRMEHGDVALSLDVLVPAGSNSGVYLMGRYEVQIRDSWGADPPRFSDMGGLYERWDAARGVGREGYAGHPPRIDAARAPGLWQHLEIVFRAPRFDDAGRKTDDARFERVALNGVVVHENVRVTGPTRAAAFADERPLGPLMLQGDHGPVAFRDLRVKRYGGPPARLADLTYRDYAEPTLDLAATTPRGEGPAEGITVDRSPDRDRFTVAYDGRFHAPAAGDYLFDLNLAWVDDDPHFTGARTGAAALDVAGRPALRHDGAAPQASGTVRLDAGAHPFRLVVFKDRAWSDPRMTLHVEGPGFSRMPLHAADALPPVDGEGAIVVDARAEPVVLRTFIPYDGEKRTHAAAVGDPAGVHYAVDLAAGALLYAWRGPFVEATPMWSGRGSQQTSVPLGVAVPLGGGASVAVLDAADAPWPAETGTAFEAYALDADGRPTFTYRVGPARVEDALRPALDGRALHRRLTVSGGAGATVRLAQGARIVRTTDGYRVDDAYYVVPDDGTAVRARRVGGRDELVADVPDDAAAVVSYTLVW